MQATRPLTLPELVFCLAFLWGVTIGLGFSCLVVVEMCGGHGGYEQVFFIERFLAGYCGLFLLCQLREI